MADHEVDDALARSFLGDFLVSPEGRQVTYRYTRPGDVLGIPVLVGGPVNAGVQAVEPSSLFRVSSRALTAAARRDAGCPGRSPSC